MGQAKPPGPEDRLAAIRQIPGQKADSTICGRLLPSETVNWKRGLAVYILLKCILVLYYLSLKMLIDAKLGVSW